MDAEDRLLIAAAQWAGQHALPLFVLALVAVLGCAAVGWWTLQRHVAPRLRQAFPRVGVLALCLAGGFLAIAAAGWVFAELADELHAQEVMGRADQALTDALQRSVPVSALHVFAAVTRLGDTSTIVVYGVAGALWLTLLARYWEAVAWGAVLAGNGLLNTTLKLVFERARPLHEGGIVTADGYSFPSGHSSGSVVAFGMFAYVATRVLPPRWHLPVLVACVALAFTVGASRVFLRVHFASDVLAGFASGTAWLAVCIASMEYTRWYRARRQPV